MYLLSNDEWCQFWWYFSFLCRWLVWGWQVDRLILSFIMNTVCVASPYQGPGHFPPSGLPASFFREDSRVRGEALGPAHFAFMIFSLCNVFSSKRRKWVQWHRCPSVLRLPLIVTTHYFPKFLFLSPRLSQDPWFCLRFWFQKPIFR